MTADFQATADVGGLAVSLHHLFSLHPYETVFRESGCDCHRDILKITQTRRREMDGGRHRVQRTLCIYAVSLPAVCSVVRLQFCGMLLSIQ